MSMKTRPLTSVMESYASSVSGIRSSIVPLMPLTRRPGSLRRVTLRMTEPLTPEMSVGPFVYFMITEPLQPETYTVPSMAAMLIEPLTPLEVKLHGAAVLRQARSVLILAERMICISATSPSMLSTLTEPLMLETSMQFPCVRLKL